MVSSFTMTKSISLSFTCTSINDQCVPGLGQADARPCAAGHCSDCQCAFLPHRLHHTVHGSCKPHGSQIKSIIRSFSRCLSLSYYLLYCIRYTTTQMTQNIVPTPRISRCGKYQRSHTHQHEK